MSGFVGDRQIDHVIRHEADGWYLDNVLVDGLGDLVDLDYGFTPATNLPQVRRADMRVGEKVELPVVWFDVDADTLTRLPQLYERRSDLTYWYEAPTMQFEGLLIISENGFALDYPSLWKAENIGQ